MSEEMKFPDTLDEFIKQYSFIDKEQIYTNGSELIHTFRVKQWEEHKRKECEELKRKLNESIHKATEFESEVYELKKQLEEWNHHLKCSKEMLDIQGHNGNYNYDSYMLGIYNGMEYIISLFETREPIFKSGKDIEFISELQQENQKYKEVIDKANKKLNNFIGCCKAEKLESGSDYIHHQYWDMFERFNKQVKDILNEVSE